MPVPAVAGAAGPRCSPALTASRSRPLRSLSAPRRLPQRHGAPAERSPIGSEAPVLGSGGPALSARASLSVYRLLDGLGDAWCLPIDEQQARTQADGMCRPPGPGRRRSRAHSAHERLPPALDVSSPRTSAAAPHIHTARAHNAGHRSQGAWWFGSFCCLRLPPSVLPLSHASHCACTMLAVLRCGDGAPPPAAAARSLAACCCRSPPPTTACPRPAPILPHGTDRLLDDPGCARGPCRPRGPARGPAAAVGAPQRRRRAPPQPGRGRVGRPPERGARCGVCRGSSRDQEGGGSPGLLSGSELGVAVWGSGCASLQHTAVDTPVDPCAPLMHAGLLRHRDRRPARGPVSSGLQRPRHAWTGQADAQTAAAAAAAIGPSLVLCMLTCSLLNPSALLCPAASPWACTATRRPRPPRTSGAGRVAQSRWLRRRGSGAAG